MHRETRQTSAQHACRTPAVTRVSRDRAASALRPFLCVFLVTPEILCPDNPPGREGRRSLAQTQGRIRLCRKTRSGFERLFCRLAASGSIDDKTNIACFAVFARRKKPLALGPTTEFSNRAKQKQSPKTRILLQLQPGRHLYLENDRKGNYGYLGTLRRQGYMYFEVF